ncbi:protein SCO1/2 [Tenacibaculum sp. MAR_2009_124]|uniref:SCO family protein n=1 Tax=Tenacibaculum sp. MAR_2009_124 TaxID=1250059 RepID=UPI000895E16B|nr:SCO family protein [Tenacibaculum sp. MAR_2009_124]SEC87735.1 protein SCO1/2 [Tenacibaculum sp. MAR_2009_124]
MYSTKIKIVVLIFSLFVCCKKSNEKSSRVATLPYYKEATFRPHWLTPGSDEEKSFHKIPSFSMTNQEGEFITNESLSSKIYIVDFFFTSCPGICPKMTDNMSLVQGYFKEDEEVMIVSFSVTPEKDSVQVLRDYANNKNIDSKKWYLLTGIRKEIYDLGRKAYFVEEDLGKTKSEEDFLHTENFVLIDSNRHIRGIYNGLNRNSVMQLIADIKTLKEE